MNELMFWKWNRSARTISGASCPIFDVLILELADDRAHRGVEQPVLAVAVVADDVEDPDMADRIGERAEVAGDAADLGDRLLALGGRGGIEGDPDRGVDRGSSSRCRPRPSYGRVSGGRSWSRSARSSRPP